MGKTLVHQAKMVSSAPLEEEPGMIFAAFMPRSAVIQGTFQVMPCGVSSFDFLQLPKFCMCDLPACM